jgi:hypothetical protein
MSRSIAAAIVLAATIAAVPRASSQSLAPVAPDALVAYLMSHGIDPAMGFRAERPINCMRGAAGSDSAYRCVVALADAERGGKSAALEIMIFNGTHDFADRNARVKAAVARLEGRWSLDYEPDLSLKAEGRTISLKAACHQSRGRANSPAYCLLPVTRNVLVFSQVAPAQASTQAITTSTKGEPDSFDDMARAGTLASLGAVAVASAQPKSDAINHASETLIR